MVKLGRIFFAGLFYVIGLPLPSGAATVEQTDCVSFTFPPGVSGGTVTLQCSAGSGVDFSQGSFEDELNFSTHTHKTDLVKPGHYVQHIVSNPPWDANGFTMLAYILVDPSFQGNEGDVFSFSADLIAEFSGGSLDAHVEGILTSGHEDRPFTNTVIGVFPGGGGPFDSYLIADLTGPGELNITRTGIGTVVGAPEPATWVLLLAGFGLVGGAAALRRRSALRTQ